MRHLATQRNQQMSMKETDWFGAYKKKKKCKKYIFVVVFVLKINSSMIDQLFVNFVRVSGCPQQSLPHYVMCTGALYV